MTEERRRIVIAMDGSKDSENALDFYIKNIRQEKEDLVILHCVHHRVVYTDQSFWSPTDPEGIFSEFLEDNERGKEICKGIERKLKDFYKVEGQVIQLEGGEPGYIIVEKANELGASVIIVGSRGLGTLRRTLLGSVSDYILHHAKSPVFICRH